MPSGRWNSSLCCFPIMGGGELFPIGIRKLRRRSGRRESGCHPTVLQDLLWDRTWQVLAWTRAGLAVVVMAAAVRILSRSS